MSNLQRALFDTYAIDELVELTEIRPDALTLAWRARVRRHGVMMDWCIKKHRSTDQQRVAFEAAFCRLMSEQAPHLVPNMVPRADGGLLFQMDEATCSIQQWAECDKPCDWLDAHNLTVEQCALAGAGLAEFHATAARIASRLPSGWEALARPYLPFLRDAVEQVYARALQELPPTDLLGNIVAQSRQGAMQTLSRMLERLQELSHEQTIIVHGDYHPGNTLFHLDRLAAVIDFDYVHRDQSFYDVGYAAYMFSRRAPSECSDGHSLDAPRLTAFVRAYEEQLQETWLGPLLPRLDAETLNVYLHLGAFLVAYWLLNVYLDEPDKRQFITLPLTQALLDVSRTMEPWRGTLYI